ncbi:zinc finger protein 484-like [Penaeus chinensis]|uniref:zinc finger protein 484-like n=1 Tax=Penaeus chinensis TaxID=139456 RepID=UPI001FB8576A|nr:zinc finger protein 484-like [Penaeus chinensis]
MGEFTIECTLCGGAFGCEKDYDAHPCMEDDVKVPFKIKLEQREDEEETELESETQRMLKEGASSFHIQDVHSVSIKEEPEERMDFNDEDPLDINKNSDNEMEEPELEIGSQEDDATSETEELEPLTCNPDLTVEKVTDAVSIRNECGICGKRFYQREDFLNHRANSHKIPRPFQCKICKKRFTQKHYVTLHMRVHTGERPYKCKLCANTYTHKTSFTIHMRIHNGERPYMCGVCGKKCYDKSGLTSHMRSHTKETPYQCEVCGRRFTHSKSLLVHRRNHTGEKPYECQYCGKCFRHWHKHKIHIRLHTGERPYRCTICGKGFPRNDEVKRHMRSHQGIKSFKCSICGVYCATQASITGHIDLHHADLKQVDASAPEKTVVRDSNSGILGTKAPQPRTIYKPVSSAVTASSSNTSNATTTQASSSQATKTTNSGIRIVSSAKIIAKEMSKKSNKTVEQTKSGGKTKTLTYKEFIELQEKLLKGKAAAVKIPTSGSTSNNKKATEDAVNNSKGDGVAKVKNIRIFCPANSTAAPNANLAGKQIMVLSPQNGQVSGGAQFVVPHSLGLNKQMIVTAPSNNGSGPRFVIHQPDAAQTQLGGQQVVLLSQPSVQQNQLMLSQPVILLTGGVAQQMVLMPSKTTVASTSTTSSQQAVVISKAATSMPSSSAGNSILSDMLTTVKKEPEDPQEQNDVSIPKVVIKQEPGVSLPNGVVIKQEPLSDTIVNTSSMCNVIIKQEPQDDCE